MGPFQGFKMVLCPKSGLLEGPSTFLALKWPSLSLMPFNGPKKSRPPLKVSILCQHHLESSKWPHVVIFKGWFHNFLPHAQHRTLIVKPMMVNNSVVYFYFYFTVLIYNTLISKSRLDFSRWISFPGRCRSFINVQVSFQLNWKSFFIIKQDCWLSPAG